MEGSSGEDGGADDRDASEAVERRAAGCAESEAALGVPEPVQTEGRIARERGAGRDLILRASYWVPKGGERQVVVAP